MGNGRDFYEGKRYGDNSEYVSVCKPKTINGVKGTIVKRRGSDTHTNLPRYADKCDMYFRQNVNGVCQGRVYVNHKMTIDFDWSHSHTNKSGDRRTFRVGVVHVQVWKECSDGTFVRITDNARYMNNYEMKKYGPLLKAFCPSVKFR